MKMQRQILGSLIHFFVPFCCYISHFCAILMIILTQEKVATFLVFAFQTHNHQMTLFRFVCLKTVLYSGFSFTAEHCLLLNEAINKAIENLGQGFKLTDKVMA